MREIVSLHLGQCGTRLGAKFWGAVCDEHGIDQSGHFEGDSDSQLERLDVYFAEASGGRFVPRSVLVDLEPGTVDAIRGGPFGELFNPASIVCGTSGASNNFAKGKYTAGAEMSDAVLDVVRRSAEACDRLHGFQLSHSLGGGTGSGMGSLLIEKLREEYSDRMMMTFSVLPSPKVSDIVVEPYNAVLGLPALIEGSDLCVTLDNEALYNLCSRQLKIETPTFTDLNHIAVQALSHATCSFRFPGQLNSDIRKLAVNLVPFPRLHFLTASLAPLIAASSEPYEAPTLDQLVDQLFMASHATTDIPANRWGSRAHLKLTASIIFRGRDVSAYDVDRALLRVQCRDSHWAEWLSTNVKATMCDVAPAGGPPVVAAMLCNHFGVHHTLRRLCDQFAEMLRRQAFVHWFTEEGMDASEFSEAECNVADLASEYHCPWDDTAEEEEGDFDDEG